MLLGTTWTVRNIVRLSYWKTKHQRTPIINLFHSDFCFIHFFLISFFGANSCTSLGRMKLLYLHLFPLKTDSHLAKKICIICFTESLLRMMENAFHFISKALFVLKIFKFLSWQFGHVRKNAWLERLTTKFMTSQTG